MCAEFGGFDPRVMETPTTSALALDPGWSPVRQAAAIAVMAEETARAICPPDLTVVPLQPPPGYAVAAAWRRGDHFALLDRLLGFIRGYRDTHARPDDAPRLSLGAWICVSPLADPSGKAAGIHAPSIAWIPAAPGRGRWRPPRYRGLMPG